MIQPVAKINLSMSFQNKNDTNKRQKENQKNFEKIFKKALTDSKIDVRI